MEPVPIQTLAALEEKSNSFIMKLQARSMPISKFSKNRFWQSSRPSVTHWSQKVSQPQWQQFRVEMTRGIKRSKSCKTRIEDSTIVLPTQLATYRLPCKSDLSLIDRIYINQLMLSFTHNSKSSTYNINQLDFQPLIISNKEPSPLPLTKNPQKKISKTVTQSRNSEFSRQNVKDISKNSRERYPEPLVERDGWQGGGKI